jgi:hypothetical protein
MEHDHQRGLRVALEEALDRRAGSPPPAAPTQLALLDEVGDVNHKGNAGKGRPPGRRNRRTEEWLEYFARYPSPIELLLRTAAAPLDEFSRELGCSKHEAVKLQIAAATAAAPFLHPRLSAIELHPPGHPDGIPSTLILQPQESAIDFNMVADVAASPAESWSSDPMALSNSIDRDAVDCTPLVGIGAATTLSVTTQDDVAGKGNQLESAVEGALDTLVEAARNDPRQAGQIRARLTEILRQK